MKHTLRTTSTPPVICRCGAYLSAVTDAEKGMAPKPGDFSICLGCLQVHRFDESLKLQQVSDDEFLDLPSDVKLEIARAIHRIVDFAVAIKRDQQ